MNTLLNKACMLAYQGRSQPSKSSAVAEMETVWLQ